MSGNSIKVVVRCRPLNSRELARGDTSIISMSGNSTTIEPPPLEAGAPSAKATERKAMTFAFDHSYWSAGPKTEPGYASQETLYKDLGVGLLDHSFQGFNTCIFAYGQTGSGKSYSMMGYGPEKGIIPLTTLELFKRADALAQKASEGAAYSYTVEVSYIEIYNEKVRDLLNPKNKGNLKVREHPSLGPYVEDLSRLVVGSYNDMMNLMDEGNKARTVAATQMNETSSRSHAVFTLILTQKSHDPGTNLDAEKVSRISLVDLAGSERANSTGATGARLKEGANINKSLTTLGKVIAALAAASAEPAKGGKKKKADEHIPYRDSVLTWLLKDSLGGNSQTAMIAALSPSAASYDETLSTLRYADQAKKIKTRAVVNEDPNAKMIRELKEELEMLRSRAAGGGDAQVESFFDPSVPPEKQMVTYQTKEGEIRTVSKADLQDQMQASEKLMQSLNETWEEKIAKTEVARKEREQALEELGITVEKGVVGVHTPKKMPHLVNLNEDPLMSECLVYQLKPGKTIIGNIEGSAQVAIRLSGSEILEEHCVFTNENGVVTVDAMEDSMTIVNGQRVLPGKPQTLRSGFRLILGDYHVFRFNNPEEVRKHREQVRSSMHVGVIAGDINLSGSVTPGSPFRPDSPMSMADDGVVDWTFAKRELALARLNGQQPGLDALKDEDLDKLFDNIQKVRTLRKGRPESRFSTVGSSGVDDTWENGSISRHLSSNFTDDTFVDPNAPNPWGAMNGSCAPTPVEESTLSEESPTSDELAARKIEIEARLEDLEITERSAAQEDLALEKAHLERTIGFISQEMTRLLQVRARGGDLGASGGAEGLEARVYSAREIRLATKAFKRWKTLRTIGMAETVLTNAIKVKEANVIGHALGKSTLYNFAIFEGRSLVSPKSALDSITDYDDVLPASSSSSRSGVGVKVLDYKHSAVYVWSFDQFLQKLAKMRNVTNLLNKPAFSEHFSSDDAFYDSPPPSFSFIGTSSISLAPLARKTSTTTVAPIFCRTTSEAIGSARISISISASGGETSTPPRLSLAVSGLTSPTSTISGLASSAASSGPVSSLHSLISVGSKLVFLVTVDNVKGLSSDDYSAFHVQCRLTSFAGPSVATEDVYHSNALDLSSSSPSDLVYRRKFSLVVTAEILAFLRTGYAPIEFFAKVRPAYLDRLARWDKAREEDDNDSARGGKSRQSSSAQAMATVPMRRSENDFVQDQLHDILTSLQVCELDGSGDYVPVTVLSQGPLDPGALYLRQGLQRKLVLNLSSTSSRSLPWVQIARCTLGNVRLLGANGQILESQRKPDVELKLQPGSSDEPIFHPDGTSTLSASGFWDSSAHDSTFLNRPTAANQRVLVRVTFMVQVASCEEPAVFAMDAAFKIQGRGASGPGLLSVGLFGSARLLNSAGAVFSLKLSSPLTRSARDLHRLDTSGTYIRGEESLPAGWKPRGVSVVVDHRKLIKAERRAADVAAMDTLISLCPSGTSSFQYRDSEALLRQSVDLWSKALSSRSEVDLTRQTEHLDLAAMVKTLGLPDIVTPKLVPHVSMVPRTDNVAKKGYLNILVDAPTNVWARRFFILRRPYLHIYKAADERDPLVAINLNGSAGGAMDEVAIVRSPDVEHLLGRKNTFTVFTRSNSYVLQAASDRELEAWRTTLDPTATTTTA